MVLNIICLYAQFLIAVLYLDADTRKTLFDISLPTRVLRRITSAKRVPIIIVNSSPARNKVALLPPALDNPSTLKGKSRPVLVFNLPLPSNVLGAFSLSASDP